MLETQTYTPREQEKPRLPRRTLIETSPPEAIEAMEDEPAEDLRDFLAFVERHEKTIDDMARNGQSYADIFRDVFYAEDREHRRYERNAETEAMRRRYDQEAAAMFKRFQGFAENYKHMAEPPISSGDNDGDWIRFDTFGGLKRDQKIGRAYLNIRPEHVVAMYEQIMPELAKMQVRVRAKIEANVQSIEDSFNRYDKMVIYFNEKDDGRVIETVQRLHQTNSEKFLAGIPRFATQLTDAQGREMSGVGFAEEPEVKGESFGTIVGKVLEKTYLTWKNNKTDVRPAIGAFQDVCRQFGRDPKNPAFNTSSKGRSFSFVRFRSAGQKGALRRAA